MDTVPEPPEPSARPTSRSEFLSRGTGDTSTRKRVTSKLQR
jgi:hypothetical protein